MNRSSLYFLLLLLIISACHSTEEKVYPQRQNITEAVYASGVVKSRDQYQVFPKASGTIESFTIQKGDSVKAGQIIAHLSNETSLLNTNNAQLAASNADFKSNLNKLNDAALTVEFARKKLLNDSLTYHRQQTLWAEQIGTHFELEQRELAYANSKTAYESAQLRYADLKKQLEFASKQSKTNVSISRSLLSDFDVKSQVNGRVYSLLKEKGEMVGPQTPLAIIGDASSFCIYLQVDENDIVKVKPGQKVILSLDSYKGQHFEAEVSRINPLMNERSRTFEVEAQFTQKPAVLYPNLTVEGNIILHNKENALTIPRSYLVDDSMVFISPKEKKKIKIGLIDYQQVEVVEGLTAEDAIYKVQK